MGFTDFFKAPALRRENERLNKVLQDMGAGDALAVAHKLEEYRVELARVREEKLAVEREIESLREVARAKQAEIIVLDDELLFESFALYKPKFAFQSSDDYRERLDACRARQRELVKEGAAVTANENWKVNNSAAEGRKMVNDMKKLVLRSFNNECDYCVDHVRFNNIEASEKRIDKSFEVLNKLGRIMRASITEEYRKLKHDELHLAFEYQQKKQEEKEELKRIREEQREQQKLEQEIRQARERIAKERRHYAQAVKELQVRLDGDLSAEERGAIELRLAEYQQSIAALENEEKVIDYREQNAKAGYVYVISNNGSFGEGVYKIGMTRRLEPMDRVDELGDASVPFTFDVHALIFSENAPALEAKLHEHFRDRRVNRLNDRKEFFRADIHEIEQVIRENYDKVVDVVREAPAEQYRESLLIGASSGV
jgi:hypothetical protein